MTQQYIDDFIKLITAFQHLWRSARFVGYAGKTGTTWLFLGGRILLSEDEMQPENVNDVPAFDEFSTFVHDLPMNDVPEFVREIVNSETINMDLGKGRGLCNIALRLANTPGANNLSQWQPFKFDRKTGATQFGVNQVGYRWAMGNDWQILTLGAGWCLERANELLKIHTHIADVESLTAMYTPGLHLHGSQRPELQVVAPLPFLLEYDQKVGVRCSAPTTTKPGDLSLKVFFKSHPAQERILVAEDRLPDSTFAITWQFKWPEGVDNADIHLLYCQREVEGIAVSMGCICDDSWSTRRIF